MQKVGIIGAGLSSLYAACHLAKNGYQVTVFEKNTMAGGRSQYFEEDGFKFDMGPSWYWMPDVVDRLFKELDEEREDYFHLTRLDPAYQVFWKNSCTSIPADTKELEKLFNTFEPNGGKKLRDFLHSAKIKYNTAMSSFVEFPGLKISELVKVRLILKAMKLDMLKSIEKDIKNRFVSDEARSILGFPALLLGERASKIPSMYTLMNYADFELGTWYPDGGMNALAQALEKIAVKNGVEFHYKSNVESIEVKNGLATGLKVDGKEIEFDHIIAGADYHFVEQNLIPKAYRRYDDTYWDKRRMAPSSLMFYIGLNKKIDGLEHHNLFFDESIDEHGKEIYEDPKWPRKPLFYVCTPSKTDNQVAPDGCENLMILIPIAPELEDNEEIREKYFGIVIDRMESHLKESMKENIVYKNSFCVEDFKNAYNSYKGNAYGLANTLRQTANFRPKMKSKLKNVYFCGQLTVPGPGIPPSLISGKIAAKQLLKENERII